MKKLIEDLIIRLEIKQKEDEIRLDNIKNPTENKEVYLIAGKNIAFDFCIKELYRIIEFNSKSQKK